MIQVRQRDDAGMRKGRDHAQQFQMMLNVQIVRRLVQKKLARLLRQSAGDLDEAVLASGRSLPAGAVKSSHVKLIHHAIRDCHVGGRTSGQRRALAMQMGSVGWVMSLRDTMSASFLRTVPTTAEAARPS